MANRYALLIGTSEYHDERLARLKTPAADLDVLAKLLEDRDIGNYQVKVLLNQPFTTVLKEIVSFLKDKHRDDHLLLYFSGHGILDEGGNLYLATKDTERDLLSATALSNRFIKDEMDRSRSKRQVLVLDCCHSGAFLKGTKGAGPALTQANFEGYGRAVLTAADSIQYALEGDQVDEGLELSLFTHFLVEGIQTGEADRGNDGWIELDEWFDYAFRKVRDRTERQTPRKFVDNQYGELYIARNPKASVIKPAELPERLRARIKSEYKPDRLEAIQELGGLLDSDDPSMVATAQIALEKISIDDDSLSIRSSAAGLLTQHSERQAAQKAEEERQALEQAEAERLAALKIEEVRLAEANAETERLVALKAEEKRLAREQAEAEKQATLKAKEERERVEAERLAALKAEKELQAEKQRLARQEAEANRMKEEKERLARQSAERDERQRLARERSGAAQQASQLVEAGSMAGAVSQSERLPHEMKATQAPGVRKTTGALPRWAIWVGLVLVGSSFVGLYASRMASMGPLENPLATQNAASSSPTIEASPGNVLITEPAATLPIVVLPTNTPPSPVSAVEPAEAAVQATEDTERIAFFSYRDGDYGIYVMNADGSEETQLTSGTGWKPAWWSPDGTRIAFAGYREINVMNADGSGLTQLNSGGVLDDDYSPGGKSIAWSPDGKRIAFGGYRDSDKEIYVINTDGSGEAQLTNNSFIKDGFPVNAVPAWSPDGSRIAFTAKLSGSTYDIYVMNADGSGQTKISRPASDEADPAWSPDGTRITFLSTRNRIASDIHWDIFVMNADGSEQTELTSGGVVNFAWSPDSTRIVFALNGEIYMMNADGSGQTQLTSEGGLYPAWSPDGTRIAFVSNRDGNYEIYVMSADGSGQTRLTNNSADDYYPVWQP